MGQLKSVFSTIKNGWSKLSGSARTSIIIILCSLVVAVLVFRLTVGKTEYVPIFTKLDIKD